jgi:YebC/PmpR family DNA-binding regulatory protein
MGAQWKAKGKEAAANAKGRIFTKLAKEIMVAARNGANPDMNPRLRLAVEQAKKASMPKDTLERAIKKGAGLLDEGVNYEKLTYEGFAPHRVPVIVECLTDNANRTASNIRVLFRKGQLGALGSVSWDFDYLGMIGRRRNPLMPTRSSPPSRPVPAIWNPAKTAQPCSSPNLPTWMLYPVLYRNMDLSCSPPNWVIAPKIR